MVQIDYEVQLMINYPKATEIQQSIFIGTWDDKIPVYHVPSMHALNQLIGYMKHINSLNGTVLYRGQCELYRTVSPCILRDSELKDKNSGQLETVIDAFLKDKDIMKLLGFRKSQLNGWLLYEKCIVEAVLQHYGAKTFCVDFVDNHWTALWFGLYRWDSDNNKYVERDIGEQDIGTVYIKRDIESQKKTLPKQPDPNSVTLTKNYIQELTQIAASTQQDFNVLYNNALKRLYGKELSSWNQKYQKISEYNNAYEETINKLEQEAHLYLFLYVAETNADNIGGLYLGDNTYTIDLRKALPSVFLRPSSQHGWIVRGRSEEFDFNSRICCVIRINVSLVKTLLGNGKLLSQENFFPNEKVDQGYKRLLERQLDVDIKSKYKRIIPAGMIRRF